MLEETRAGETLEMLCRLGKRLLPEESVRRRMEAIPRYLLPKPLFSSLSGMKESDGVIAVVSGCLAQPWDSETRWHLAQLPRILVLDGLQDPGNVGTLLRSAEAFGFHGVIGLSCVDFSHPRVLRASMGSAFRLLLCAPGYDTFSRGMEDRPWIGADLSGSDYRTFAWPERFGLILGNEGNGLSETLASQLSAVVTIPMAGRVESLNVAVSGTVLMAGGSSN